MRRKFPLIIVLSSAIFFVYFLNISFDKSELKNLNNGEVLILGHSGMGFSSLMPFNYFPSNSYSSVHEAVDKWDADGVEVDLHMTADGKFILYHDSKLDSKSDLEGCIETMKYQEVLNANYSLGFPYDIFQEEKLIGLDSLVSFFKSRKEFPFLHLDIRSTSACLNPKENGLWEKSFAKNLIQELDRWNVPKEKVLIISLSREFLKEAIRLECPYPLSLEEYRPFEEGLAWVIEHDLKYLTVKPKLLSKESSALAHEKGIQVITFGAKSKSGNKKLLELNPDMIQTDNIEALRDLLN